MVSGFWAAAAGVSGPAGAVAAAGAAAATNASGRGSVHFAVERDRIPELIKDLEEAKKKLEAAADLAVAARRVDPMGKDPFSPKAADRMGPQLVDNYLTANQRQWRDIDSMIKSLEAAMKSYDNAEDVNRDGFNKRS